MQTSLFPTTPAPSESDSLLEGVLGSAPSSMGTLSVYLDSKPFLTFQQRLLQHEDRSIEAETDTNLGHVFSPQDITTIRDNISRTVTPSWLTSIPSNLGAAAHGKLKADQWRVLGSVYLPLSLIALWASGPNNDISAHRRFRIMEVTLSLLSA